MGHGVLLFFIIGAAMYFLPTLIAVVLHRRNTGAIFVLNLLLGWTFFGWVISLVWALMRD